MAITTSSSINVNPSAPKARTPRFGTFFGRKGFHKALFNLNFIFNLFKKANFNLTPVALAARAFNLFLAN